MSQIVNTPYWTARQRSYATYGFSPHDVDVAIIGDGLYGLAIMYWLSQFSPGYHVLLEKSSLGVRNSSRSLGTVNTVPDGSIHTHGPTAFLDRVKLADENKKLLTQCLTETELDFNLVQNGGLHVAISNDHVAQLEVIQRHLSENGFACESLNTQEIRKLTGGSHFFRGLYYPGDMMINPYALMMVLAETCSQTETNHIVQNFNVINVEEKDLFVEITSDTGCVVRAQTVVICNNELIGQVDNSALNEMAERGFRRSQTVVTEPVDLMGEVTQLSCRSLSGKSAWSTHNKRLFHSVRHGDIDCSLDYYGYHERDLQLSSIFMHKHFGHCLQNIKREFLWTDYYIQMSDLLPVVQYKDGSDRIIINAGYDYSFMDLMFVVGQRIAAAITGGYNISLLGGKDAIESTA